MWRKALIFLPISCIIAGLYLYFMLFYTNGNLSCPLDDSFIFYQYARQIKEGNFLRYNSEDPPTTGATSLLYTLFLALPFLFGIDGDGIIVFSFIFGILLNFLSSLFVWGILYKISESSLVAYLGGVIFLLCGPLVWGYLSGMDLGLFTTLILATYYFYGKDSTEGGNFWKTAFAATMLALTRPEGWFLAVTLVFFILIGKRTLTVILPIIAIIGESLLYLSITGEPTPHSMQAKSHLYRVGTDWVTTLQISLRYFFYIIKELFGATGSDFTTYFNANAGQGDLFFPPLALFFFMLGVIPNVARELVKKKGFFITLGLIWFFLPLFACSFVMPVKIHWFRYLIPYFSIYLIFFTLGLNEVSNIITKAFVKPYKGLGWKQIFICWNLFYIGYFFLTTLCFGIAYGRNCKDIYLQQMTLSKWIDKNLPKDSILAINDVGAIKYYGKRRIIDLVGLVTPGVVPYSTSNNKGNGAIYEYLEKINPKPDYFIIYPSWFLLGDSGILGEQIVALNLFDPSIAGAGSEAKCVFKAKWEGIGSGEKIRSSKLKEELKGYKLVDKIDIADIGSERKHNYRIYPAEPGLEIRSTVMRASLYDEPQIIIIDGGRVTSGGEEMRVGNLKLNKELKVIMRTAGSINLGVYVNNTPVGQWREDKGSQNLFSEYIFSIPKEYINSEDINLKLEVVDKHRVTYFSCYYFFYQKE